MTLHHLIRQPEIVLDKNPLLLLIHGYGSNEEDLFSFASELPKEYYVISLRAPHDLMYGSYAWYAIDFDADENKFSDLVQARSSRDLIANFIDEAVESYAIDKNDVTIIGFSQGTILGYAVALSYPEKVQRLVAISGYLNAEILIDNYEQKDHSRLSIFASHGVVDQVIPVDWARKAKPILDSMNIPTVYKEYPIGHGVSPQNFYDFRSWLENR
jgi:phospholipase/carboxylesterase